MQVRCRNAGHARGMQADRVQVIRKQASPGNCRYAGEGNVRLVALVEKYKCRYKAKVGKHNEEKQKKKKRRRKKKSALKSRKAKNIAH